MRTMIKNREVRTKCNVCDECMMWNEKKACVVGENDNIRNIERNNNDANNEFKEVVGMNSEASNQQKRKKKRTIESELKE